MKRGPSRGTGGRAELRLLLRLMDQGFDHAAWHGPTLGGAIRGLTARQAAWRPAAQRHSVWEIVLHTAYWKYAVRRRLTGGEQGVFPRSGSNWPALPEVLDQRHWRADVRLLKDEHRKLLRVVAALSPSVLGRRLGKRRWTNSETIHGIAMHDLYHAGQIQLLKRLRARD
ncbi:MAG: DinB family protein [Gemmatimonadetes bacterium]|nr:DinB family protein [Gemmatimonadota bacterium]